MERVDELIASLAQSLQETSEDVENGTTEESGINNVPSFSIVV